MSKNNYIKGYDSYNSLPELKKKSASSDAGKEAARKFAEEKRRNEIKRDAELAAQKAGVTPKRRPIPKQEAQARQGAPKQGGSNKQATPTPVRGTAAAPMPSFKLSSTSVLCIIAIVLIIFTFNAFGKLEINSLPVIQKESVMGDVLAELEPALKEGYVTVPISASNVYAGTLMLVNPEHSFNFNNVPDYIPAEELATVNSVKTSKNYKVRDNTVKLNRTVISALDNMFNDFFEATGKKDVMISAGYRTHEAQQTIYDKKVAELGADQKTAVLPGYSEHHTGYAMDFNIYTDGGITKQFTAQEEYAWVAENAYKYGFVLRYPEGKTGITGVDYEVWHYRYVGAPHAYYLYTTGKTLEEYLMLLKNYPCDYPLYLNDHEGTLYTVYYKASSSGGITEVPVPENGSYTISGNNVDGYIVTVKSDS